MFSGCVFFFQAEDGIRDLVRSRGLGDVYKRQASDVCVFVDSADAARLVSFHSPWEVIVVPEGSWFCLLYTSDAADDLLCVDLGGRRIIKKTNITHTHPHKKITNI